MVKIALGPAMCHPAAEVLGYESWTLDYNDVLNHPDPDVVSICAPSFQPGAGISMGFDDLKTIEARLFLESVTSGKQLALSAANGWSAACVSGAAEESAADGTWHKVGAISGTTIFDA
jgi:hypothetical protein